MSEKRGIVLDTLARMGIEYELWEHPAVYTIEEMDALPLKRPDVIAKNLFLRDAKGKCHFLVVLKKEKSARLDQLQEQLGSTKLSFASAERLDRFLGLEKGAVTPFGVLNDEARAVEVVLDSDLMEQDLIGVHPNENTATVVLKPADLLRVLEEHGNPVKQLHI